MVETGGDRRRTHREDEAGGVAGSRSPIRIALERLLSYFGLWPDDTPQDAPGRRVQPDSGTGDGIARGLRPGIALGADASEPRYR